MWLVVDLFQGSGGSSGDWGWGVAMVLWDPSAEREGAREADLLGRQMVRCGEEGVTNVEGMGSEIGCAILSGGVGWMDDLVGAAWEVLDRVALLEGGV